MTLDDINRTIFLYYLGWLGICFGIFAWTSLGEGWRLVRGQSIVFSPPLIVRIVFLSFSLAGASCLLINQDSEVVGCAILLTVLFVPGILVSFGVQEFSANLVV